MVIVPDRFIFLETPRAASRSVAKTLLESAGGAKQEGCRHLPVKDVPRETGLPVWTITRHPLSHMISWYKYGVQSRSFYVFSRDRSRILHFSEFLDAHFAPLPQFAPNSLNIYRAVAEHFWPLEQGLAGFYAKLGIKPENEHKIGEIKDLGTVPNALLDVGEIDYLGFSAKFKHDMRLYRQAISVYNQNFTV